MQVVDAVLQRVSACTALAEPRENTNLVPFRIIRMAGDGRCGWRSLLAALDPDAHELVPRTSWCVLATYIYIYIYAFVQHARTRIHTYIYIYIFMHIYTIYIYIHLSKNYV